jgi:hypothetical protein
MSGISMHSKPWDVIPRITEFQMLNKFFMPFSNSNLLRVMIQMHDWELRHLPELQTVTGRELYFRISEEYLKDPQSPQLLKLLQVRSTERAIRQRVRQFEEMGLIDVSNNTKDKRTKRVVPTEFFLLRLNQHLDQLKKLCDGRFLMVDKNQ